ncbi:MAG: Type 1 glutamine amidotransferase-like domain-containing protein [Armatimonadota bacterium]
MKLLLTSAGIRNGSIREALVELLGQPIADCHAVCIPTTMYGHPWVGPGERAWEFIAGREPRTPMCELEWKSMGVLELTALPSIQRDRWTATVRAAHVLLVAGGDAGYLAHWVRESGLDRELSTRDDLVWVGLSAGSMVAAPRIGSHFVGWRAPGGDPHGEAPDAALGWVDFAIFPHLNHPDLPGNTREDAGRWAAEIGIPGYAIDDETAIVVDEGTVRVVSEGEWVAFPRPPVRADGLESASGHRNTTCNPGS